MAQRNHIVNGSILGRIGAGLGLCVALSLGSAGASGQTTPAAGGAVVAKAGAKDEGLSEAEARRLLGEVFVHRLNGLVARFIPSSEFIVKADVEPKMPFLTDVPYAPAGQAHDSLLIMSAEQLKELYVGAKIEIKISKRFDEESRSTISALVQAELGVGAEAIKILDLQVKGANPDEGLQRQLDKAEADLRAARTEMEQLRRERNDAKNELLIKQNLQKDPPAAAGPSVDKKTEEKQPTLQDNLLKYAPLAAGGLLLLIMIFLSTKMFSSAIRSVGAGIGLVANSLASVGGVMKVKAEAEEQERKGKDAEAAATPTVAAGGGGGGPGGTDLEEKILRLNKELLETLDEKTESVVLKTLAGLLARPESIAKGVATLELLGKSKASELFSKLGKEQKTAVQAFLRDGNYGRPKFELMAEAGEELKTKILGEGFGQIRGEFTLRLAQELLKISEDDLFAVLASLDVELKARLFVYLEPATLSALVARFEAERKDQFEQIVDAVAKMAKVERDVSRDAQIADAIGEFLAKKVDDPEQRYMPYFQQLVESLSGELAEKTVERLGATNPGLKAQLSKFVVTFKTLFKLPIEVRKEVLDPFSNKQLAALAFGMEASLRGDLMACIIERRHEQINDEVGFLAEMNPKESRLIVETAQAAVVASLKKMRASGLLQEHLDAPSNGAPAPVAPAPAPAAKAAA